MHKTGSWAGKALLLLLPLLLGFTGFVVVDREPVLDSLFKCVTMYVLNYSDTPCNWFVELARWTAPLSTAGGVLLGVRTLREWLGSAWHYRRGDSVAVYGPEAARAAMLARLKTGGTGAGIEGRERFVRAGRYLLLWDEAENFRFYALHKAELAGHEVYLRCHSLPAQATASDRLHLFCPEETAALLFWKEHCGEVFRLSQRCSHHMKAVLIGFGRLGEEVLTRALLNNIFSAEQCIEYHIFGADGGFAALHTELDKLTDKIIFHPQPWYEALPLLAEAQLVLVMEQQDQPALLKNLLLATGCERIFVFSAGEAAGLLDGQPRLELFDWQERAEEPGYIFNDSLFALAKRINASYRQRHPGAPDWAELSVFKRYSNISAACYQDVRRAMLPALGLPANAKGAALRAPENAPALRTLSELEHIRWCRYHYLQNWKQGSPRDDDRRIHPDLVPYADLTPATQDNDTQNVLNLLAMTE